MKKILTASLVAIMAVTAANADIASTGYVNKQTGADAEGKITLTGKAVDGATTLAGAVNKIAAAIDGLTEGGAGSVSGQIDSAVGNLGNLGNDENGQAYTTVADAIAGEVNELATGAVKENADAIEAIKDSTNGIQAVAKNYTDGQIDLLVGNVTGEGVVTSISQTDGKVTAELKKIGDAQVDAISTSKITGLDTALAEKQLKSDVVVKANALTDENLASDVKYPSMAAAKQIADDAVSDLTQSNTALQGAVGAADTGAFKTKMSKTGNLTQAGNAADAAVMLDAAVGAVSAEDMGTTANTVVGAIKEVVGEKADKATSLAGYGIADAYTKTETDNAITTKVNTLDADVAATANNVIVGIKEVDGKLTEVTSVQIKDAYIASDAAIAKTKLAADVQTSLGAADTAMQWAALKSDASWTTAGCNGEGVICSLVADGGNISWQKVVK